MTKFTKEKLYTELSIQIATLDMKLDKILELLNTPQFEVDYCEDTDSPVKVIIEPINFEDV